MSSNHHPFPHLKTLRGLLPHLSEEDYQAAEERFWRFIELARKIEKRRAERRLSSEGKDSTNPGNNSKINLSN